MNKKQLAAFIVIVILLGFILIIAGFKMGSRKITYVPVESPVVVTSNVDQQDQVPACNIEYDKTNESKVASEENPVLVTAVEKKCDGNWYVTVDYLGPAQGNPEAGDGSYFTNTNMKLRTFKVVDGFDVFLADPNNSSGTKIPIMTYLGGMKKQSVGQTLFGRKEYYIGPSGYAAIFTLDVQNGQIVKFDEVYLP